MIKLKNFQILKHINSFNIFNINTKNLIYLGEKPQNKIFDLISNKISYINNTNNEKFSIDYFYNNSFFDKTEIYAINKPLKFILYEGLNFFHGCIENIISKCALYDYDIYSYLDNLFFNEINDFNGCFFGKSISREFLIGIKYVKNINCLEFFISAYDKDKLPVIEGPGFDSFNIDIKTLLWLYQKNLNEIKYIETTNNAYKKRITNNKTHIKIFTELNYTSIIRDQPFNVKGHWRKQKCGIGRSEEKLIFIDSFKKNGYKRFIKSA